MKLQCNIHRDDIADNLEGGLSLPVTDNQIPDSQSNQDNQIQYSQSNPDNQIQDSQSNQDNLKP